MIRVLSHLESILDLFELKKSEPLWQKARDQYFEDKIYDILNW